MSTYDYDIGDRAKIYTSTPFYDVDNAVDVDPTTVTFTVKTPAGVSTDYVYGVDAAVKREATGDYYMEINITAAKSWYYRIAGLDASGDYMGASEGQLNVKVSNV